MQINYSFEPHEQLSAFRPDERSFAMKIMDVSNSNPVIITCALTGGIHGKEANSNLPEQPDEIVEQGIAAWNAGAAILHVHARNPDGSNTMAPDVYSELHQRLRSETDAIIQLTTGGSPRLPVEERLNTIRIGPEMCSLNMGLLNFFIGGEEVFFSNHRSNILRFAEEMRENNVRPELEIYNSAMIEEVHHLLQAGILQPPYALNFVLNTPTQGGQRGTPYDLFDMMLRLEHLPVSTDELRITVSAMGRTQLPMTTIAMSMGLNIRVGMEDNVYYRRGELLANNAQLVERSVRIAREVGREVASPSQARDALGLRAPAADHR